MTTNKVSSNDNEVSATRRRLLQAAAMGGVAFPLGLLSGTSIFGQRADAKPASAAALDCKPLATGEPLFPKKLTPVKLAWLNGASCVAPVALAQELGLYRKYNLDVELKPYKFHTPEFLASPANGESDAAVTMLHNWLFAINRGVNVRVITPVHGGCVSILGSKSAGVTSVQALRGKTLPALTGELSELGRAVYAVILRNHGLNAKTDVNWLPLEESEIDGALREGRIQGLLGIGPPLYAKMQNNPDLVELADNWTGPMAGRACCVAAAGEKLWRDNPLAASGLVLALNEASEYAAANPQKTAEIYSKYNPTYSLADLQGAARELDFHSHHFPLLSLRDNIVQYAIEFQAVGALPPDLEIRSFVERSYAQIKTHA